MSIITSVNSKRVQVNKTTALIVIVIAVASFVTVFSLVASKALLSQRNYQSRVIAEKEKAKKQLDANLKSVTILQTQYKAFENTSENLLGGNPAGNGDKDGDNARLILDALPSKYDFPALATSLEKILTNGNYKIDVISGNDDEIAQDSTSTAAALPQAVPMPFQVGITGSYVSIQSFIGVLEHSIRPIQVNSMSLTSSDKEIALTLLANTYYQPSKTLNITLKDVK